MQTIREALGEILSKVYLTIAIDSAVDRYKTVDLQI